MSLVLKSNKSFSGDSSVLPTELAPLPTGATYHFNFKKMIFVGYSAAGTQIKHYAIANSVTTSSALNVAASGEIESSRNAYYESGKAKGLYSSGTTSNRISDPFDLSTSNWARNNLTIAAPSTTYGVALATATAGTAITSSVQQAMNVLTDVVSMSIFAKKGTAQYLMIESTGDANCFAVFDLDKGVVTNVGKTAYSTDVVVRGNYLQCNVSTNTKAALTGNVKYSIVKSAKATPSSTFTFDGTETMYLGLAMANHSSMVCRMAAAGAVASRIMKAEQKVTCSNDVTFVIDVELGKSAPLTTRPYLLSLKTTTGSSIGYVVVAFNALNASVNPSKLSILETSSYTLSSSYDELMWTAGLKLKIAIRLSSNKLTIVHKDFVIQDVALTSVTSGWTLVDCLVGENLDGNIISYTQYNKSLSISEMQQLM